MINQLINILFRHVSPRSLESSFKLRKWVIIYCMVKYTSRYVNYIQKYISYNFKSKNCINEYIIIDCRVNLQNLTNFTFVEADTRLVFASFLLPFSFSLSSSFSFLLSVLLIPLLVVVLILVFLLMVFAILIFILVLVLVLVLALITVLVLVLFLALIFFFAHYRWF